MHNKTNPSPKDSFFMSRALELAQIVKGNTFPNPAVGAVIVSRGKIVGEGATQQCGGPHAERVALGKAGNKANGATLYVTLEPCCHFGRTSPCTDAIIAAGIKRVVAAIGDPNPRVNGKGRRHLIAAGIAVETGLLRNEAHTINEDFFWAITKQRAWITLKLACTLDGRIADELGASRWITGAAARQFVHELRRRHAGIAVGRATLEHDDPRLTVRHCAGFSPARCVFSSTKNIPSGTYFARHAHETRSIVVIAGGKGKKILHDASTHLEYWYTGESDPFANISVFAEMAFQNDITSILVEGGQKLGSAFLEKGLVNRAYFFFGNKLLGKGKEGILFSKGLPIEKALRLKKMEILPFGDTVAITGVPDNLRAEF